MLKQVLNIDLTEMDWVSLVTASILFALSSNLAKAQDNTGLRPGDSFKSCNYCPEMVVIPSGSFAMGGERAVEQPNHEVTIDYSFAVSKFPVTLGEFRTFIDSSSYSQVISNYCWTSKVDGGFEEKTRGLSWAYPGFPQDENHPVVCISWIDAQRYISWLNQKTGSNYRLLSESEWEYIARSNNDESTLKFISSYSSANLGNMPTDGTGTQGIIIENDTWYYTSPVNGFAPNDFGIYDLQGNTADWISDCVNGNYLNAPANGEAWREMVNLGENWGVSSSVTSDGQCLDRITRGPSWLSRPRENWFSRRDWYRFQMPFNFIGFRVALTLEETD